MPIYEYTCNDCQHSFEKLVRLTESGQDAKCPRCQGTHTQKKLSMVAASRSQNLASAPVSSGGCSSGNRFT